MNEPPKRRRFQFRLRTLMIVVTLLAVPLGYVGWQAKIVRDRRALVETIRERGGYVLTGYEMGGSIQLPDSRLPWLREWLGDQVIRELRFPTDFSAEDMERFKLLFPEEGRFFAD